jgi:sugar lactone lactonase YvrE
MSQSFMSLVLLGNLASASPVVGVPHQTIVEVASEGGPSVAEGHAVEKFTDIASPAGIAFDPAGNLYVGNAASSGYVRFVTADGATTDEIGGLLDDPDFVVFDEHGFVGEAGSVLVGALDTILQIDPDTGITTTLFSGPPLSNVGEMEFDSTGRLFAGQVGGALGAGVVVIDQGTPSVFFSIPDDRTGSIAVDEQDNVFVGATHSALIYKLDPSGALLGDPFASVPISMIGGQLAYASVGPFSGDLFAGGREDGNVFRVDGASGDVSLFMSGLEYPVGLAVGQQGDLFVGDFHGDAIYRVFADCNENGIPDYQDIAEGTSSDANDNGIPDECESAQGVPTVSEWGTVVMTLLVLTAGTMVLMRRGSIVRQ